MLEMISICYTDANAKLYDGDVVEQAIEELRKQEEEKSVARNTEYLNLVLAHIKYMVEEDVMTWGVEIVELLKQLEEIYKVKGIAKIIQ